MNRVSCVVCFVRITITTPPSPLSTEGSLLIVNRLLRVVQQVCVPHQALKDSGSAELKVVEICGLLGYYAASCGVYRRFGTTYRSHPQGSRVRVFPTRTVLGLYTRLKRPGRVVDHPPHLVPGLKKVDL
jgi:hypothetical protein